jgi:hypothetical protein
MLNNPGLVYVCYMVSGDQEPRPIKVGLTYDEALKEVNANKRAVKTVLRFAWIAGLFSKEARKNMQTLKGVKYYITGYRPTAVNNLATVDEEWAEQ